jgi:hypothetical protein
MRFLVYIILLTDLVKACYLNDLVIKCLKLAMFLHKMNFSLRALSLFLVSDDLIIVKAV